MAEPDSPQEPPSEPDSETFVLEDEDHTLANALRFFLNKKWGYLRGMCLQSPCVKAPY